MPRLEVLVNSEKLERRDPVPPISRASFGEPRPGPPLNPLPSCLPCFPPSLSESRRLDIFSSQCWLPSQEQRHALPRLGISPDRPNSPWFVSPGATLAASKPANWARRFVENIIVHGTSSETEQQLLLSRLVTPFGLNPNGMYSAVSTNQTSRRRLC